jgi:hypothetical protein
MRVAYHWGTEPEERARSFPCDQLITADAVAYYRGITVAARPPTVFRWLCQMRVAPYSYDWIDNFGRRSPQSLTPGIEQLAVGQSVMQIFTLVDFVFDRHLTLRLKPGDFWNLVEELVGSYVVVPAAADSSRLLVKLLARYRSGVLGSLMRYGLPWGDLIMMRRQLLNLKALAERTERY